MLNLLCDPKKSDILVVFFALLLGHKRPKLNQTRAQMRVECEGIVFTISPRADIVPSHCSLAKIAKPIMKKLEKPASVFQSSAPLSTECLGGERLRTSAWDTASKVRQIGIKNRARTAASVTKVPWSDKKN